MVISLDFTFVNTVLFIYLCPTTYMTNATITENPLLVGKGLPPFDKMVSSY